MDEANKKIYEKVDEIVKIVDDALKNSELEDEEEVEAYVHALALLSARFVIRCSRLGFQKKYIWEHISKNVQNILSRS